MLVNISNILRYVDTLKAFCQDIRIDESYLILYITYSKYFVNKIISLIISIKNNHPNWYLNLCDLLE